MRKFLTVILTVLILASVALPVLAAEAVTPADKTTADDAKSLGLIVTEYISDTLSPDVGPIVNDASKGTTVSSTTYNAFQYIEIYNSGEEAVDLYKVAIGATNNTSADANGNRYWSDLHRFQKKMTLRAGSIYTGVAFKDGQESLSKNKAENPNSGVLEPGKTAVIWFWNDSTNTIANKMTASPGAPVDGVYHKGFRDFYNVPADTLVLAVYAGSDKDGGATMNPTNSCNRFYLTTGAWTRYGLIDESGMGANGWTVSTPIWDKENGYNERIIALFGWGSGTNRGVNPAEGLSTVYVPANVSPDLYNAYYSSLRGIPVAANNYTEIAYVDSYKEVALMNFTQSPTPGVIPVWQAAYIKASKGYVLDSEEQNAIDSFVMDNAIVYEDEEETIDIVFKTREELESLSKNHVSPASANSDTATFVKTKQTTTNTTPMVKLAREPITLTPASALLMVASAVLALISVFTQTRTKKEKQ